MTLAPPTPKDINLMKRLEVAEYLSQKPAEEPKPTIVAKEELDKTDARILQELFPDRSLTT
jgi:hypothetical protein